MEENKLINNLQKTVKIKKNKKNKDKNANNQDSIPTLIDSKDVKPIIREEDSTRKKITDNTLTSCTCNCCEHSVATKSVSSKDSSTYIFGFVVFILLFIPIILHSVFNLAFSPVLTGSMRPHFNPGDVLITKQISADQLKVGQIAVLRNGTSYELYSHRIISITPDKTLTNTLDIGTKGDANPTADVGSVQINKLGQVPVGVGRIPWVGRVIVTFANSKGKFIGYLFIIIFIILMVPAIFKKKTDPKNSTKEK